MRIQILVQGLLIDTRCSDFFCHWGIVCLARARPMPGALPLD